MKRAQLVAKAVTVLCPECGEAQPNLGGSVMWSVKDFAQFAKARAKQRLKTERTQMFTCVSCHVRFLLTGDTKVMFR